MIDQQTRDAINRAADFFEANPDKRVTGSLATLDADGDIPVFPLHPKAQCWCALGRIAKELELGPTDGVTDPPTVEVEAIYTDLTMRGLDNSAIYSTNDCAFGADKTPRIVKMLREIASDA